MTTTLALTSSLPTPPPRNDGRAAQGPAPAERETTFASAIAEHDVSDSATPADRGGGDERRIGAGEAVALETAAGVIALDGERELSFSPRHRVAVTLDSDAMRTVDAGACMHYAARHGLFRAAAVALPEMG